MSTATVQPERLTRLADAGTLVRAGIGLFLLITAGLKVHGLGMDPLATESFSSSPRVQIATIQIEVLIGLGLLASAGFNAARRTMVTWAALIFFGIVSALSLYQALDGQASCGCFGVVEVNPWWTFALDLAFVALLISTVVRARAVGEDKQSEPVLSTPNSVLKTALGTAMFLALILGGFVILFENPAVALAQLRGESISVDPVASNVGAGLAGESRTFQIELINRTDHPVRIVGGTTSCACVATDDLPVTLEAHGPATITVRMTFKGAPGRFQHRFIFYTDDPAQPTVVARFVGRVVAVRSLET